MINMSQERIKAGLFLLALLLLWSLITVPAAATHDVILDPNHTVGEELTHYFSGLENVSVNQTLLHHLDYPHELEIPSWLWMFFCGGTFFFLLISLMYRGAISVNLIASVISILFAFISEYTSFIIRDYTFFSVQYSTPVYEAQTVVGVMTWEMIQPVTVAWDYMIPFWFMFPVVVICIINFIALALEIGKPGINHFRAGIMRRP